MSLHHRLAESGLRVPSCASLLGGMENSPSQGVEVLVLADQDFEATFLADTRARLGRVMLRGHDHVASLPSTILYQDRTCQHSHHFTVSVFCLCFGIFKR